MRELDSTVIYSYTTIMKKLFIIIILIFFFFFTVQAQSLSVDEDLARKIRTFWEYISRNETRFFSYKDYNTSMQDEMNGQIRSVNENLSLLLSSEITNNKRDLVITAGGNIEYFGLCDKIVEMSPKFVQLNPISLIPPLEKVDSYTIGNVPFSVDDVRVHFDGNDDISLFFILSEHLISFLNSDRTGQLYPIYLQVLFMMSIQVLGERVAATKIKSADIAPLSTIIMPSVPFKELGKYIY
jgi:hypothetical protein